MKQHNDSLPDDIVGMAISELIKIGFRELKWPCLLAAGLGPVLFALDAPALTWLCVWLLLSLFYAVANFLALGIVRVQDNTITRLVSQQAERQAAEQIPAELLKSQAERIAELEKHAAKESKKDWAPKKD